MDDRTKVICILFGFIWVCLALLALSAANNDLNGMAMAASAIAITALSIGFLDR